MVMKACLNGRERDVDQWAQLFAKSDSRFKFFGNGYMMPKVSGGSCPVLSAVFRPISWRMWGLL